MEWRGHADMLHDTERNALYQAAIERRLDELRSSSPVQVIDVGTGSGILACVAAAGGASVTAFECVPKLAALARRVAESNRLAVDVLPVHSTSAQPSARGWAAPPHAERRRAALLTHELLDTGVLSEGLLAATRHACDVLLAPGGVTVPHALRLYAQPVRCRFFRDAATLHALPLPPSAASCAGAAGYLELDVRRLLQRQEATPLAPPVEVLRLDLSSRPPEGEQSIGPLLTPPLATESKERSAPDALVTWWECDLHPRLPPLSTSPWRPHDGVEREHWLNAVFLCSPAGEADGEVIGGYDDDELWLDWRHAGCPSAGTRRACTCGLHVLWGAARLQQLNRLYSPSVSGAVAAAVGALHAMTGVAPRCVDLSDGPLLSIYAARAHAECVCVERSAPMRLLTLRFVASAGLSERVKVPLLNEASEDTEEGNGGRDGEQVEEGDEAQADQPALPSQLRGPCFELLLLDPSFSPLRGMWSGAHVCEMIRLRRWAEEAGIVAESTPQVPSNVRLMCALLECPDLWRRHQPVGEVSGIDMSMFNRLQPTSGSAIFATVAMGSSSSRSAHVMGNGIFSECATDAFGSWQSSIGLLDLYWCPLCTGGEADVPWVTPTPWAQGICFLEQPTSFSAGDVVEVELNLDLRTAALAVGLHKK
ncbi:hypothetical protein AB1Y20_012112 [Prymnesium parvum]|uniref:Protein arginine N-methyltransferase n=1 Tax=Prymnesium parvum TaxID=97485 RepID=A0AB34IQU8_PRYPA